MNKLSKLGEKEYFDIPIPKPAEIKDATPEQQRTFRFRMAFDRIRKAIIEQALIIKRNKEKRLARLGKSGFTEEESRAALEADKRQFS